MLLTEKNIKKIADKILKYSKARQTEVVISGGIFSLTRFARNCIHQNVSYDNWRISVRVILGKKIGVASTNIIDSQSLKEVVDQAIEIAKNQKEDPNFQSLPRPKPISKIKCFYDDTAGYTPEKKANKVKIIIDKAKENKLISSGSFIINITEQAVVNSLGIFAYCPSTYSSISTIFMSDSSSGFADQISRNARDLNAEELANKACDKTQKSKKPIEIKPGKYTVILEEPAVNEMLMRISDLGCNGKAYHEGRSFISGKLGKKVMGENVTIWDDGLDEKGLVSPFDCEGVPKSKVEIIKNGIACNVVYDSYHALKYKKKNTGHALCAPNPLGPLAYNLFMKEGKYSKEQMLASIKEGIWITRFWYNNILHHKLLNMTGMTRDGTFLIKGGEIVSGIKNLRFTQSIPEAFSNIEMISRNWKVQDSWIEGNVVPALKIKDFNFTGGTEF